MASGARRRNQGSLFPLVVGVAVAASLVAPGRAQAPHPVPAPPGALHERVAEAERIVLAQVVRVEEGRIEVSARATLRGAPPESFEIKRSPLRPPPLAPGDRALLFLRGARPPYVLAGEPSDVIAIASDAEEAAWRAAMPEMLAASARPDELTSLYADWLAGAAPALRDAAERSLPALVQAHPEQAVTLAERAVAPATPSAARGRLAAAATIVAPGAHRLVALLAKDAPLGDAEVVAIALRAARAWRAPDAAALAARVERAEAHAP